MSKAKTKPTPGQRIVKGLKDVADALDAGGMAEVEKRFTVRRVKIPKPAITASEVAEVRGSLGVSQGVFADLLGVSASAVRAWERGANPLSGMAERFLDAIRSDHEYWRKKVKKAAA